ncbi:MAG: serine hydrolase domain-containing protein [Saprospiraceae bacterium]
MKIALYVVLGLIAILVSGFVWFNYSFKGVPALTIPKDISTTEAMNHLDKWFELLHAEGKFNGAILIAENHQPQLMKAYGFTNYKEKEKLTTESSFRLASVSKQFTAAGIMLLKEKGLLDYDKTVHTYLPDLPYKEATVRQLLNQTSGIPDTYLSLAEKHKEEIGEVLSIQEAVGLVSKYPKKATEPNEKFVYSNTNYILLAGIIETISGQSFEDYMQSEIFTPLQMKNTRVWNLLSKEKTFPNKTNSISYLTGKATELAPDFLDGVAGDGGVFSSIEDFLLWDKFWYENPLISAANLAEAFKQPILNNGAISNYGFGWVIVDEDVVVHSGSWLGARTLIVRNRKNKRCRVLLDNALNFGLDNIAKEIGKNLPIRE